MTTSGSFRLLRFRGIELRIHFSLVFLLIYVVFVARAQVSLFWGLLFALGLFASVVLHEFGHAITAKAQGREVRAVTLMMLGGITELGQESANLAENGYAEFRLAVIGPAVSILIAAVLFLIHSQLTRFEALSFYTVWLGRTNLGLAFFNLLPAFPLDGGRALRGILATRMGMIPGTKRAVAISHGFSWFLGVLGLLYFNVLLMLIAIFIHFAARAELSMLLARKFLSGLEAKDLMVVLDPIDERATLRDAASLMMELRQSVLPVQTQDGRPALIALENLRLINKQLWSKVLVTEVMDIFSRGVALNDPVSVVLQEIYLAPGHILPVQNRGRIVGIIRYADLSDVLQFKGLEEAA